MDRAALQDWWDRSGLAPEAGAMAGAESVSVDGDDPVLPVRHRIGGAAAAALAMVGVHAAVGHHERGGFPHLASGLLDLLGLPPDSEEDGDAIAGAVGRRDGQEVEDAIAIAAAAAAVRGAGPRSGRVAGASARPTCR